MSVAAIIASLRCRTAINQHSSADCTAIGCERIRRIDPANQFSSGRLCIVRQVYSPPNSLWCSGTVSPNMTTFGISGVSHTSHGGFQVEAPGGGRTLGFDSLDAGITLGLRVDALKMVGLSADSLTLGLFGNYTNSDIDVDTIKPLRELGLGNVGNATLNNGSAGGYALLTNGSLYGLGLASGEFGEAKVDNGIFGSSDFATWGFASSIFGGTIMPIASKTKVDFRGGLNYLTANAEDQARFG